jgi:regulatory protein
VRPTRKAPKLEATDLYEYAVRVLSVRTYSAEALRTKLKNRALRTTDVDAAIERLVEVGYLDDSRFAESFARYKVEGAGLGRTRVLSDLRGQRIPQKIAEQAVEQIYEGKNEADLIDAYIERRLPDLRAGVPVEDQKVLVRSYNRLRRAGFSSGGAWAAIKRRAAQPELLEEPADDESEQE